MITATDAPIAILDPTGNWFLNLRVTNVNPNMHNITMPAYHRWPDSISAAMLLGTTPPSQSGQSGQPSPDPETLTHAP